MATIDKTQIREHMTVVGSDGVHVGTVDRVEGERIKLTKGDAASGGEHRFISLDLVETVDDEVHLSATADDAKASATR